MSIFISSKHIWDGQKKDVNNEPEVFLLLLWIMRLHNLHGFLPVDLYLKFEKSSWKNWKTEKTN